MYISSVLCSRDILSMAKTCVKRLQSTKGQQSDDQKKLLNKRLCQQKYYDRRKKDAEYVIILHIPFLLRFKFNSNMDGTVSFLPIEICNTIFDKIRCSM